jgi:hypothetical protein
MPCPISRHHNEARTAYSSVRLRLALLPKMSIRILKQHRMFELEQTNTLLTNHAVPEPDDEKRLNLIDAVQRKTLLIP